MSKKQRTKSAAKKTRLGALLVSLTALLLLDVKVARAQAAERGPAPALLDNMDGRTPRLKLLNTSGVRVLSQTVEHGQSERGVSAERLDMTVPAGVSAMLAYDVPPSPVIEELRLSAWVACNR